MNRSRQITDYSCGASALRAVLSYWGRDVDEAQLMALLRTNSDIGTNPEDIASGARSLGFDAEVIKNLTLDQVEQVTADGVPVIALAQVWLSEGEPDRQLEDIWDNGHYIVVLGVDDDYVYFQDPFIQMSKAFVPRQTFEDHWHQVMGGDLERNPKLVHLGIVVRGKRQAKSHIVRNFGAQLLKIRFAQSCSDAVRSISAAVRIPRCASRHLAGWKPEAECLHLSASRWEWEALGDGRQPA
jgi:predicted double-glycine peptidase